MHPEAMSFLAKVCDGDARRALSALEIGVLSTNDQPVVYSRELAQRLAAIRAKLRKGRGDARSNSIEE